MALVSEHTYSIWEKFLR